MVGGIFSEVVNVQSAKAWKIWLFESYKDLAVAEKINQLSGGRYINLAGETNLVG